jgi:hypothetical protein
VTFRASEDSAFLRPRGYCDRLRVSEDSSCLRPLSYRDWQVQPIHYMNFNIILVLTYIRSSWRKYFKSFIYHIAACNDLEINNETASAARQQILTKQVYAAVTV